LKSASLNPASSTLDTCHKILGLYRTLLRSEGQAVLLRDGSSSDESYRVVYTGNAIRWSGLEEGSFGLVSLSNNSGGDLSVIQSVLLNYKTVAIPNIHADSRYKPVLDGLCGLETPYLVVPLRGKAIQCTNKQVCILTG
jgi:hypothetical protein